MTDSIVEFYNALWGESTAHRSIWYGEKEKAPNISEWFVKTEDAIKFYSELNKEKKYDIYHACALFSEQKRQQIVVCAVKAFWFDLDLKDFPTINSLKQLACEVLPKFKTFPLKTDFWVVSSGYGLHVYWMLKEAIPPEEWLLGAKKLKLFCKERNIKIDNSRTTDSSSMLRCPETVNLKKETIKKTHLVRKAPLVKNLLSNSQLTTPQTSVLATAKNKFQPTDFNLNMSLTSILSINNDFLKIVAKCPVMRQFAKTGLDESEPMWHHALSIPLHCRDGDKWAHVCSAKSPRYDSEETSAKLDRLFDAMVGPCLCETFEGIDPQYCVGCKYKGKIKSCIQFGTVVDKIKDNLGNIETDKRKKRAMELIELCPKDEWEVGEQGIFKIVDDVKIIVSKIPFFIIDKFCEDTLDPTVITVLIRAKIPPDFATFKVHLKILSDEKKLIAEFNSRGIFPYNKKYFMQYVLNYAQNISKIRPIKAVCSLGWQADGSFVYGSQGECFTSSGDKYSCIVDTKAQSYIDGYEQKGTLEGWKKGVDLFNSNAIYNPHLFSVLCSLGSPLLPMTGISGFVLSLQGESGCGKTVSHEYAASVWGNDKCGVLGRKDTLTAIMGRLSSIKNLPARFDEATNISSKVIYGLIFALVNGKGRARATMDGSLSNTKHEWQNITLITTNSPLLERKITEITEAERNRILELKVEMPPNMILNGEIIGNAKKENYGIVGPLFINHVLKNRQRTEKTLAYFFNKFRSLVDDSKRFWVNCGAIALTTAVIAKEANLFAVDVPQMYRWVVDTIQNQAVTNEMYIDDARGFDTKEELISALRDELTGHIQKVDRTNHVLYDPPREIKGKVKHIDEKTDIFYVRVPVLHEFVKKNFTCGVAKVRYDFDIEPPKTMRLGKSVARLYKFEMCAQDDDY